MGRDSRQLERKVRIFYDQKGEGEVGKDGWKRCSILYKAGGQLHEKRLI